MNKVISFSNRRLGVFCCGHVFRRERSVRFVVHEQGWQFLCGYTDHYSAKDGNFVIVGVLADHDPTIHEIADLSEGWEAEREDVAKPWIRTKQGDRQ